MVKKSFKNLILVLIFQSNGKWSWYQIERELGWRGIGGIVNSVKIIKELVAEGLVQENKIPNTNLILYLITDKGKEKVNQLVNDYGTEAFASNKQNPDDYE